MMKHIRTQMARHAHTSNANNFEWFFIGVKEFKYIALRSFFIRFLFILFVFLLIKEKSDYIYYMVMQVILSLVISIINFRQLNKLLTFKQIKFEEIDLRKHIKPLLILFLTNFCVKLISIKIKKNSEKILAR